MCLPETKQTYLYLKALKGSTSPMTITDIWKKMIELSSSEYGDGLSAKVPYNRASLSRELLNDGLVKRTSPRHFAITTEGEKFYREVLPEYVSLEVA